MTTTVTIRSYRMADCPFEEAAVREQDSWGVFGDCAPTVPDGDTCHVLTDVTVASEHALEALQAAVAARPASRVLGAPSARQTTVEGR